MRLLHVTPTYIPAARYGGTIYAVHGLCKGLAAAGHDVHVFTTNVDGPDDSPVPIDSPVDLDGVRVRYFPSKMLRRLYWSPAMGRALAREVQSFDLVHLHSVFLWPTWAAARLARRNATPYVLSPHGMLVPELIARRSKYPKLVWLRLIERRNLARAAIIHVTSEAEAQGLRDLGLDLALVYQHPLGVDVPKVKDRVGRAEATLWNEYPRPFALALGRISWKKRLDVLIRSLELVPGAHGVIAGSDDEGLAPKLRRLAQDVAVAHRLEVFDRWIDDDEKEALFEAASLLVLPSMSENFGLVVLEAMIRGCPVIASRDVGAAEIAAKAGAGLIFDGTEEDLAAKITLILGDPDLARKMGEAGARTARESFTWPRIAAQMAEAYAQILERQAPP